MAANPLLAFEYRIPFDQVKPEHVEPAIDELLVQAQQRLDAIISCKEPRTYANTMHALDDFTDRLEYAMNVVRHLEGVATTPELRVAYNAVQPKVTAFYSSLPLNEGLWNAIKAYGATAEAKALNGAQARFLKKTIDNFRRHGAELDAAGKKRLQEIDVELSQLTTRFSENVLDATNDFELVVTDENRLAGLPPTAIAAARQSAESKGTEGWRFTLHQPSYIAVMTYLDDESMRREVYNAYNTRASGDRFDNRGIIVRVLRLRKEKASLLGYRDFADLVLEDRMAHNGDEAQAFVDRLKHKTDAHFERENRELAEFAGRSLNAWDVGYFSEKQRKALYDFDEEALRPYFPLDRVIAGMFEIFGRVFGIRVKEQPGAPVWDAAVRYYVIEDEAGAIVGAFYADWFPRENKRGGAWMDALITGLPAVDPNRPHLGVICGNLNPPVGDAPALLTHREVETIFHEFGHLLHHSLSRVDVRSLAGTSVAWDFVELPSQIMENWCWERESLDLFARHYETGEPIPNDLYQKMRRAKTFRAANAQMRQLGFGVVDLALHREYDPDRDGDPIAYSRAILQPFSPAPLPPNHAMITSFQHLFGSPVGYGAGYYSYKWAEVLDADAFTRFREAGVFSHDVGRAFRDRILAKGDSEDPAELYRTFMGRDPDPDALLERAGLVSRA
jgi:oligopeptidase A